jgi:hypothetical protein
MIVEAQLSPDRSQAHWTDSKSFGTGDAAASDRVRSTPAAIRGLTATGGASPSLRSERDPRCGAMRGALALLRLREGELQESCKRRCLGAPTEAQGRGRRLRSRLMSPSWSSRRVHSLQGQVSRPEISFLCLPFGAFMNASALPLSTSSVTPHAFQLQCSLLCFDLQRME